jgi:hypothetical protein
VFSCVVVTLSPGHIQTHDKQSAARAVLGLMPLHRELTVLIVQSYDTKTASSVRAGVTGKSSFWLSIMALQLEWAVLVAGASSSHVSAASAALCLLSCKMQSLYTVLALVLLSRVMHGICYRLDAACTSEFQMRLLLWSGAQRCCCGLTRAATDARAW